ncbi:hypothetical protein B7486_71710 [cyanobacterium TDX16]|nr:hypothetical protein B7486_71710 [cyanobacterium TDX16]
MTPRSAHQVVVHERPDGEHVVVGEEGRSGEVTPALADEPDVQGSSVLGEQSAHVHGARSCRTGDVPPGIPGTPWVPVIGGGISWRDGRSAPQMVARATSR